MLVPAIRLQYRFLRRKFPLWFRPVLALVMVCVAALGAGAAYWATKAEEESILLKQQLVVGRFQEVALLAHYAHQYAMWTTLINDSIDHQNLGLRLYSTADSVREADPAEATRLDFQAQEEFARARVYRTFYHFLLHPDEKLSIDDTLARDVSAELARFGFGVGDEGPQVTPDKSQAAGEEANRRTAAPDLGAKFWKSLDYRIEDAHGRTKSYSRAVVLYVLALVLFTFADLNLRSLGRSCVLAGTGLCVVVATSVFAAKADASFLYLVGAISLIAVLAIWAAARRGLLLSVAREEEEPLHAHEVENKGFWGGSLFLHHSHGARSRAAITLIAISVFLSSFVGYLYVVASTTREHMSHEALKHQVAFARNSTTSAATAMAGGLQPSINLLAKQFHCEAVTEQELFPQVGADKHVSEWGGVGVEIKRDGATRVVSVKEDGPAAQAGMRAGDIITHIDGQSVSLIPLNVVVNRLRGRIGLPVTLRISRDGAASPLEFTLIRGKITGDFTVAENGEALFRNMKFACDELNSEKSLQNQLYIQRAGYETGYAPGHDMYYRALYFLSRGNPAYFYALADGYEELAARWNANATVYLANLSLFAIALYLFGQALGVGRAWQAHAFLGSGTFLVALSAGWAIVTWADLSEGRPDVPSRCTEGISDEAHSPAERLVDIAAHHYGQGEALYKLADAPADFRKSADALDCAVAARPNFGRAHSLRSSAYKSMDSSHRTDTYLPASSWSRIRETVAARTQALKAFQINNVDPAWILSANAFDELVLALTEGDHAALGSAIQVFAARVTSEEKRETTSAEVSDPDLYVNYGLALLADNRPKEAEAVYRHAIKDLHVAQNKRLVVEALTDLRMLATNCAHLQPQETCASLNGSVRKIKESLVGAEWHDGPITEHPGLSDISVQVTPYSAGWRGRLDPSAGDEKHKITVVWYMLDTASESGRPEAMQLWRSIHGLSRTVEIASLKHNADGTVESEIPYLKEQSQCLAEGTYVPEIYIDGALVSPADLPGAAVKQFETYRSRYLNVVMCRPAGWKMSASLWQIPMRIFLDAQNQESALVFAFHAPRGKPADELKGEYLGKGINYLFGINPTAQAERGRRNIAAGVLNFHGCDGTVPKGAVPHREWVTSEGFVYVALVFPWIPTEDACQVLSSLNNYFEPYSPPEKK
jgi:tetratricopeptide (TPR) repeat protein